MNPNISTKKHQRGAFTFWHVLILVAVAVTLALCAHRGTLPFIQQPLAGYQMPTLNLPRLSSLQGSQPRSSPQPEYARFDQQVENLMVSETPRQNNSPAPVPAPRTQLALGSVGAGSVYDEEFPPNLNAGSYYTVQVFAGYNSRLAYELRRNLRQQGYNTYLLQVPDSRGVQFKVRIGAYYNRADAFAMRDKIRRQYPKSLGSSFVLLREK
ncbi:MAG TPA: SPOR domain-containing protein [Thiolinea sp.]|nr:SPOR domain-containing protein [Thiolinea sp.]